MRSNELVNYAAYGSLTRKVAVELLGRTNINYIPALIPGHGLRMLRSLLMGDAERKVLMGADRLIAVPDERYRKGILGGVMLGIPREETAILRAFDDSSEGEYELKKLEVIALFGRSGEIQQRIPALFVARKKIGRNYGERRDPRNYDPYEPFMGSEGYALEVARQFREEFLSNPSSN